MPIEAQAKLLRVLQTKEVTPLGSTQPYTVDVRIVCATHQDLAAMQAEGRFRGDLYARLNEYNVTLPPLSQRKEDIYALCIEFLRLHKRPDLELTVPYMTGVLHYDFPYNVRELEALIKRGIALVDGDQLGAAHLSAEIHERMRDYGRRQGHGFDPHAHRPPLQRGPSSSWVPPPPSALLDSQSFDPDSSTRAAAIPSAIANYVPAEDELRQLLAATGGNVAAVGRHYGKERMQVHRWMRKYNIDPNEYRPL
jgi:DNA-binding NtrC family response regulator